MAVPVFGATDMRSTSAMRDKPVYRSSYGQQYTGSFRNNVPAYTPQRLGTVSAGSSHSYGGCTMYVPDGRGSGSTYQYQTGNTGGYGAISVPSGTSRGRYSAATPSAEYEAQAQQAEEYAVRSRFYAPPSGGKETQWTNWWATFAELYGEDELTEDNLRAWWYTVYGGSAAPDDYQDFYNWCKTNNKFASLPIGNGVPCLLLCALLFALFKRHFYKNNIS